MAPLDHFRVTYLISGGLPTWPQSVPPGNTPQTLQSGREASSTLKSQHSSFTSWFKSGACNNGAVVIESLCSPPLAQTAGKGQKAAERTWRWIFTNWGARVSLRHSWPHMLVCALHMALLVCCRYCQRRALFGSNWLMISSGSVSTQDCRCPACVAAAHDGFQSLQTQYL